MNHTNGSPWQMGLGAWLLATVSVVLVGITFAALGYVAWTHYQVTSAGVAVLNTSKTSSYMTLNPSGQPQKSAREGGISNTEPPKDQKPALSWTMRVESP